MVADYVSAKSPVPDGKESPRAVIRPGSQRDGYFTDTDIVLQCTSYHGDGYPSEALPPQ